MNFMTKWAPALVLRLARATPALTLAPENQADLSQPGSVIIFPKFITSPGYRRRRLCAAHRDRGRHRASQTDLDLILSVDGKLAFPADLTIGALADHPRVPPPPRPWGYLIGRVVKTIPLASKWSPQCVPQIETISRGPENTIGCLRR
jgi:hypothetical protein